MKLSKIIGLLGVFLCIVFVSIAQEPDATALLEASSKKVHALKNVKIKFEYSITTVENSSDEVYKGEFLVKGKKYKLSIDETVSYSDGKTRWVYLVESNEVNISEVVFGEDLDLEEQFLNEPLSIYDLYTKGFKVGLNGSGKVNDVTVYEIDLTPNDLDKPYFKIRYIITEKNDLHSVQYFQKDGTKVLLSVKSLEGGNKVKDSDFVFNSSSYPDVEVIDLR